MKNNFFPWKLDQNWKLWIFLLQFCKFSAILWCNLFKILDFDRNNLFKHCCFLNFWFWDQKKVAYFFRAIGVPTKIKSFQKILRIDQSGELQKKVEFCTRRHKSHFFVLTLYFCHKTCFVYLKLDFMKELLNKDNNLTKLKIEKLS